MEIQFLLNGNAGFVDKSKQIKTKLMDPQIKNSSLAALSELIDIVTRLRDPEEGCPWDVEQTHLSLIPFALEETYEVINAIRNEDDNNLCEELGDLLLQVILHSQIAGEQNRFNIADVAEGISKKLIRRHPHVFDKISKLTYQEVKTRWEAQKALEKPPSFSSSPVSDELRRKIYSQSEIAGAMTISKKVAQLGFEWESIEGVLNKVDEELAELKDAIYKKNKAEAQQELGDVIFTLINIARWYGINLEEGLAGTNKRFLERFSIMEKKLKGNVSGRSITELEKMWQKAKQEINEKNH